jgi:hypothetical protein
LFLTALHWAFIGVPLTAMTGILDHLLFFDFYAGLQIQRNLNLQYLRSFTFAGAKQRSGDARR